ncbi:MAG TPA: AI-2E family transporter, partial [Nautiliaceae bacterium]|nr:AI-2E family transporter [Nautiliaceae bacterium]
MEIKDYISKDKYKVFFLYFSVLLIIFYFTRKILIPIILAAILAYVTYPIYKKYWNIFKKEKLAAFLVVLQTTLIFILPLLYVMFQIIYNLINLYKYYLQNDELLVNFKFELFNILYNLIPYEEIRERVIQSFLEVTNDIFSYFSQLFLSFTSSIPVLIVYLIIIVLSQYYFLIYGKKIVKNIKNLLPFGVYNELILENLSKSLDNLIYGLIIPAFAQSASLILILLLLKVKIDYFLVFLLGFIFSFFPSLGIWVVWLPLSIKLLDDTVKLFIYILYNFLVTSNIDFLMRILVTSKVGDIPIWIIIFS